MWSKHITDFNFFCFIGLTYNKLAQIDLDKFFESFVVPSQLHNGNSKDLTIHPQWRKVPGNQYVMRTTQIELVISCQNVAEQGIDFLKLCAHNLVFSVKASLAL